MPRLWREKRARLLVLLAVVSASLLLVPFLARAVPPVPHQIYGEAKVLTASGALDDVPNGTLIRLELPSGQEIGSTAVASGRYGFSPLLFILGDDPDSRLVVEGAVTGQSVRVLIDQYLASTVTWGSAEQTRLNLQVPEDRLLVLENVRFTMSVGGVDTSVDVQAPKAGLDVVKASGTVRDRSGAAVANTTVVVRWGDGQSATTLTGASGLFQALHTYPLAGTYTATVSVLKSGFVGTPVSRTVVVAAVQDQVPPAKPTGLQATPGDSRVTLAWTRNTESDLAGYRVYRRTSTTPLSRIAEVLVNLDAGVHPNSYIDTSAFNNVTYFYALTAVDSSANESDFTVEVQAQPIQPATPTATATTAAPPSGGGPGPVVDATPPTTPTGFAAVPGDKQVQFSWNLNTDDTVAYFLLRSATSGGTFFVVAQITQGNSTYVDTTVVNGVTYYYVLVAQDAAGNQSPRTPEVFVTPGLDTVKPAAPTGLTVEVGDKQLKLSWNANTEPDLAGYHLFRGLASGGPYTQITTALLTATTYTDTGLTNVVTYYYVVRGVDKAGNVSENSNQASGTPVDLTPPLRPSGVVATPGDHRVTLTWSSNTEPDLRGYHVYQSTSSGGPYTRLTLELLTANTYTVLGLSNGVEYFYVVTAVDASGNTSLFSLQVSAIPADLTPPSIPREVAAVAGDRAVRLTWTAPPETDVAGYHVFRSLVSGALGSRLTVSPVRETSFTDSDVINGVTYHYTVRAVDSSGNQSAGSEQVAVTPRAAAPPLPITPTPTVAVISAFPIEISALVVSPVAVDAGTPITISARVANPAPEEQGYRLELVINGEVEERASGTLKGGESKRLTFSVRRSTPGIYRVEIGDQRSQFTVRGAELALEGMVLSPRNVGPGDSVRLTGEVVNTGGAPGAYVLRLTVSNAPEDAAEGVLLAGGRASLLFTIVRTAPGGYEVVLGPTPGFLGSFTVLASTVVQVVVPTSVAVNAQTTTATDAAGNAVQVVQGGSVATEATAEGFRISFPLALGAGQRLAAFRDTTSGIVVENNRVTIPVRDAQGNVALNIVAETAGLTGTGTTATATVTKLSLQTPSQEVDLRGDDPRLGAVAFSVGAELKKFPENARLTITPKKALSLADRAGFELVVQGQGDTVTDVGAAISIDTVNLQNVSVIGAVTIRMAVGAQWVAAYGEAAVRIARQAEDGTREILSARRVGTDEQGRIVFEAVSPRGFSIFSLLAVAPRSPQISLTSLDIQPSVVAPNEVVRITVGLSNAGNAQGFETVVLRVNGVAVDSSGIALGPQQRGTVFFLLRRAPEGAYRVVVGAFTATFQVSTLLSPEDVVLSGLEVSPPTVAPGAAVTISLQVRNTSDRGGKYDVLLLLNGVLTERQAVFLPARTAQRVVFTIVRDVPGPYEVVVGSDIKAFVVAKLLTPAAFTLSRLALSATAVDVGQPLSVRVLVENTGEQPGSLELHLLLNGREAAVQRVELEGGASLPVVFTVTPAEAGSYTVQVVGLAETAIFEARAVAPEGRPAEPVISQLLPERLVVTAGEVLPVRVRVANSGDQEGTFAIVLLVDEQEVGRQSVTLAGGAEREVVFQITLEGLGKRTLRVGSVTSEVEVVAAAAAPPALLLGLLALVVVGVGVAIFLGRKRLLSRRST